MPVTRDGVRLTHGSRDTYCAAAPAYRAAARRIAAALATRYGQHPAVALWHVHNEYGTLCWCDARGTRRSEAGCETVRRGSGRPGPAERGLGDRLLGQCYSAWEQVQPPRATQWRGNPGQLLDFRRFWSDELLAAYCEQRDEIRGAAPGCPGHHELHPARTTRSIDPWAWCREVDVVAVDHYLSATGPEGHADIAFAADRARSWAGGRPWLLMEQATRLVYANGRVLSRPPGRMLRDSLGYVARGSDSVLFFQWRASRAGAEMWHSAMVPHAGPDTVAFREAAALGAAVQRLGEVAGSTVTARAAVLLDTDSWWALDSQGLRGADLRYLEAVRRDHAALWRAGIVCDLAQPEADLSGYRLLLAPALYLVTDEGAESLRRLVAGGGVLVVSFGSGLVDRAGQVRLGGYPGALRDLLGVRVEEFFPLPDGETVPLSSGARGVDLERADDGHRRRGAGQLRGRAAGRRPAVTRHEVGQGSAWYLSTRAGQRRAHDQIIARGAGRGRPGRGGARATGRGGGGAAPRHRGPVLAVPAQPHHRAVGCPG